MGMLVLTACGGSENKKEGEQKEEAVEEKIYTDSTGKIKLTQSEMDEASEIFFQTCAGCHGTQRMGATGPALLPGNRTSQLGTEGLKSFITYGTPGGMPDWGKQGILSEEQIDLLARFLQIEPPPIPEFTMEDMKANWKVHVPVDQRPTEPQHERNWQNFFGVILRDAGQVAIIDGDTKEKISIIETGYAVHILRSSASGRYFYSIGRDGKVTLIDTWTEVPTMVAEGKVAYDARSIEVSKYKGEKGDFIDKYVVVGGYTPSHYVVMDALTLEPLKIVSTQGPACDGDKEFVEEARVAAIVASHHDPIWVINVKETGMVMLVDYSDLNNIEKNTITIPTARFLHDGGWDHTQRYFLVAANASNKIVCIDVNEKKLAAIIDVGTKPHPGRGANIKNSKYGNMWVSGHIGENRISFIATDPGPNQFKEVHHMELPGSGGGNLFVKTHPKSKHLWADRAMSNDEGLQKEIFVIDVNTLEVIKTITIPDEYKGRAVHFEYDKAGKEVWVSVWGAMDKPEENAILIYDDKTMELKQAITGDWVVTPTGKFNVYNTTYDVY